MNPRSVYKALFFIDLFHLQDILQAQKLGHVCIRGLSKQLAGGGYLANAIAEHHPYAITQQHRLGGIMRYMNDRHIKILVNLGELFP